jgi:hypothetical protein
LSLEILALQSARGPTIADVLRLAPRLLELASDDGAFSGSGLAR